MAEVKTVVVEGLVAEFDGKYWGTQYEDGQCTINDFGNIDKAKISESELLTNPCDLTYRGSPDTAKLGKAKLVRVKVTTVYEILD